MWQRLSKVQRILGCGLLITMGIGPAQAVPFSYSESASGDLTSTPTNEFVFHDGSNTISGTTHFGVNIPGQRHYDTDFDSFAFTLPSQMQLVGISLAFVTDTYNAGEAKCELRFCRGIDCGNNLVNLLGTETVDLLDQAPASIDFGAPLPGESGTYSVIPWGLGIGPLDPTNSRESWSADYTWTYTVVKVPEPGTLLLFLIALVSMMGRSYYRSRDAQRSAEQSATLGNKLQR